MPYKVGLGDRSWKSELLCWQKTPRLNRLHLKILKPGHQDSAKLTPSGYEKRRNTCQKIDPECQIAIRAHILKPFRDSDGLTQTLRMDWNSTTAQVRLTLKCHC